MDSRIIRSIVVATQDVFKTMVFQEIQEGAPYEVQPDQKNTYEISGVIGLSGPASGAVCVHFSKSGAALVASKLLGQSIAEDSDDARQTIAELSNMIAGGMRNELSKEGIEFEISIPTIISGTSHRTEMRVDAPSFSVPFQMDQNAFVVEACIALK